MMCFDFITQVPGKWVLAGEHAVLRGNPALVFPLFEKTFTLNYQSHTSFDIRFEESSKQDANIFKKTLGRGVELTNHQLKEVTGIFFIRNTIPPGAGLGASAALCVAITQWLIWKKWLEPSQVFIFARTLENLFHQQSSGMDIAACLSSTGIYFQKDHPSHPLSTIWTPLWYLSFSYKIGATSECVKAVLKQWQDNPERAKLIDNAMAESVLKAKAALKSRDEKNRLHQLSMAINQAATCFEGWGLIPVDVKEQMDRLKTAGAIAVKPTGAGGGGYLLSLWATPPPTDLLRNLLSL